VTSVELRDVIPDEEEYGLVLRDVGEAMEAAVVVVFRVGVRGRDAEQPGDVLERGVEQREGAGEAGHRVEREEAAEAGVALEAPGRHPHGLVERPHGVGNNARRGARTAPPAPPAASAASFSARDRRSMHSARKHCHPACFATWSASWIGFASIAFTPSPIL
uniref:Uncharacterized protein n=1 Tax=Oryza brachyantha TaxID=4533 RepID=J3LLX2_ORYBR